MSRAVLVVTLLVPASGASAGQAFDWAPGEFASGPARMFDPKGKDREAKANLQIAQGRGGTAPYHELCEVAGDYLALFRELTRHWPDDLRDTCNGET